jgi:glutamyl-tRNA reductase
MERVGVVGISWRMGGVDALPPFTVLIEDQPRRLREMAEQIGASELVYLATCNRVEVAYAGDGTTSANTYRQRIFEALVERPPEPGEAERRLRAWHGEGAAEHLFLVTAGLDSAKLGETEITGQVRNAVDLSRKLGLSGPRLDRIFEEALKVAGRIHRAAGVTAGKVSLATIALDHLRRRIRMTPGKVATIGISAMTRTCARELAKDKIPLLIVNRTLEKAEALAREVGGTSCTLDTFGRHSNGVQAIVLATGSPEPVLRRQDLERMATHALPEDPPLIVDMAVPPDVDPQDAKAAGVKRIGMDQIVAEATVNRERRIEETAEARAIVDEALDGLRKRMAERVVAPMIVELRRRYRETAQEQVEELLRKKLPQLDEAARQELRQWADAFARRLAHIPLIGLRSLAFEKGPATVDAFFAGADETLARELRDVVERSGMPAEIPDDDEL